MSDIEFFKGTTFRGSLLSELNDELNAAIMREAGRMLCARADKKDFEGFRAIRENFSQLINAQDAKGDRPLICTIYAGDQDTFDLVLSDPNIDINAPGEDGTTGLIHAIQEENPYFAFKLLERPEIDVARKDNDGDTAVIAAVYSENFEVLERLLSVKGVDVMEKNNDGESAASLADELASNPKNDHIRELIKTHESYKEDIYADIKNPEFHQLAVLHPYPHTLAFLRWADNQPSISALRHLTKKIAHDDNFLMTPQLRNFITNPDALYQEDGDRSSYNQMSFSICKHIGYDPGVDYPLVSGTEPPPSQPIPGGTS
jgi:hypothetical protein